MFLLPVLLFLPLPGFHLLSSHFSVAHSLTPSSNDCFLMALPFYSSHSFPFFSPSLAVLLFPILQFSVATTSTRQQMKTVENKSEEETILFLLNGEPERVCIFVCVRQRFILCSRTFSSRPIFRVKTTWGLLKMGKNVLLIHASIR